MILNRLLTALVASLIWLASSAQTTEGAWTFFPGSSPTINEVCPTPEGVYFLAGTNLYYYSPSEGESMAISASNGLTDSEDITIIRYFDEPKFLFIGYKNGNIDLLYPSGKVVNMADIKDAILSGSHEISDVAYHQGRLYAGTEFGLVVFDTNRYEVVESGRYGQKVKSLAIVGDHLLVTVGYTVYAAPIEGRHASLESFKALWGTNADRLYAAGQAVFYNNNSNNELFIRHLDFTAENPVVKTLKLPLNPWPTHPYTVVGEKIAMTRGNNLTLVDADAQTVSVGLPEGLTEPVAYPLNESNPANDLKNVWISVFDKGVALYDLSGTPTLKADFFLPEGVTVPKINFMTWRPHGEGLYVGRCVTTYYNAAVGTPTDGFDMIQTTNLLEGNQVTDVSPRMVAPKLLNPSILDNPTRPAFYSSVGVAGGPNTFVADPTNPDRYYLANNLYGILVIDNGEIVHVLHHDQMPTPARWGERVMDVNIDAKGNLWAAIGYTSGPSTAEYVHGIAVLPAEKLKGDLKSIKRSDWKDAQVPNAFSAVRDLRSIACRRSNMTVYVSGDVHEGWLFLPHDGNLDFTAANNRYHTEFYDQDGGQISIYRPTAVAEDKSGRIWMGHDTGVFYTTPQDAVQAQIKVKRPIVARNDGTQLGDYLLDGEIIYSIAVDHSDRKWFATQGNGVYLVNSDGTEILKHYTAENSPLPSNNVFYAAVHPHTNRVYFATDGGLVAYDSDSAPAADDFSDVLVYPNPVKPDFSGLVTIAGLMDNSSVKIADAAGNVVFSGRSEGGMVSWDACDSAGRRVRSGVYFVLAQSEASGSKESVVSKIMVIN